MVPAELVPVTTAVTVALAFTWASVLSAAKAKVLLVAVPAPLFTKVPALVLQLTPVIVPPEAAKVKVEVLPGS